MDDDDREQHPDLRDREDRDGQARQQALVLALAALSVSFQRTLQLVTADQFNRQQLLLAKAQAAK